MLVLIVRLQRSGSCEQFEGGVLAWGAARVWCGDCFAIPLVITCMQTAVLENWWVAAIHCGKLNISYVNRTWRLLWLI